MNRVILKSMVPQLVHQFGYLLVYPFLLLELQMDGKFLSRMKQEPSFDHLNKLDLKLYAVTV